MTEETQLALVWSSREIKRLRDLVFDQDNQITVLSRCARCDDAYDADDHTRICWKCHESHSTAPIVEVLRRLGSYRLPSGPEITLGEDGDLELDWCVHRVAALTINVRVNGRVGWSALIGDRPSHGHTFLPKWPEQLDAAVKATCEALGAAGSFTVQRRQTAWRDCFRGGGE